ncbi:uncharacterized protein LOC124170178 [Ischnura elegans]|uniref:uncharacterized protein LOC124170178 n=1 Tax=Ischnura elegans TaxID=197161 RepID=UPI001ED8956D|nr:uncharacterized protein LOC124170178 [Ischnura elegans]XP_046404833.1 uncharacterized protein LOC124170178 [Ischnura elegans]
MLKSGLAPLASQEDLEDVVSLDTSLRELDVLIQDYPTSLMADTSASKTSRQDDRDQHPLEVVDGNTLTIGQGADAEHQESPSSPSSSNGDGEFQSIEITDQFSRTQDTCVDKYKDRMELEKKLINSFGPSASRWSQLPIHHLLFKSERDVLKKLAHSGEENVLENFYNEARNIWYDEKSGEWRDNIQTREDEILKKAITNVSHALTSTSTLECNVNREFFRANMVQVSICLLFSPCLHLHLPIFHG